MITTKCEICHNDVESERLELDLKVCKSCAFQNNKPKFLKYTKSIKSLDVDFKFEMKEFI